MKLMISNCRYHFSERGACRYTLAGLDQPTQSEGQFTVRSNAGLGRRPNLFEPMSIT
jgi:hypothetical protein